MTQKTNHKKLNNNVELTISFKDIRMIYKKEKFTIPELLLKNYKDDYFQMELDLESYVFYELRKSNNRQPYKINESSEKELKEIRDFFNQFKNTFFFYFNNNELIGSILFIRNYIQCISIAKKLQNKGYGTLLTKFAINYILDKGYQCVELKVFSNNTNAINMYKKIGFETI